MTSAGRVQALAAMLAGTSIGLLELRGPEGTLRLHRAGPAPAPAAAADDAPCRVCSPSVGTFRVRHPLMDAALAPPGARVAAGDVVGLIEVGTLLLPVFAPAAGVVAALVAADGDIVGYGAELMRLAEARA